MAGRAKAQEFPLVTTSDALAEACAAARASGVAALDTEFVWNRTLVPRLGIVQLGDAGGATWIVDAIALRLSPGENPLAELLADEGTVKILHDPHQDLCLLHTYCGGFPRNVFDTRESAGFAGYDASWSLQKAILMTLGIDLPKSETLTDWCKRPLTPDQVDYARDDVRYLSAVRDKLLAGARERGMEDALLEEMRKYDDPEFYAERPPEKAWLHVSGVGRLHGGGRARAMLRALATLRENEAVRRNLPRNWILNDERLIDLAERPPRDIAALRTRGFLSRPQTASLAEQILRCVRTVEAMDPADYPEDPATHGRLDAEEKECVADVLAFLKATAERLRVDPKILGSRAVATDFVVNPGNASNPLASGWRHRMLSPEIERFRPLRLL